MSRLATILLDAMLLVTLTPLSLMAEEGETDVALFELSGSDMTLFHRMLNDGDPYSEATLYYRPQLSYLRRGLDWWVVDRVLTPTSLDSGLSLDENGGRLRLSGSTVDYSVGGLAKYTMTTPRGWHISTEVDVKWGRDLYVEGVFREDLRAGMSVVRQLSRGDYLSLDVTLPMLTRGLQSSASEEAVTLTGDNLYNPSWGLYDGEVRNSRVSSYLVPEMSIRYRESLGVNTTLHSSLYSQVGRRSVSRLGWYDAYNPSPDYYRKLPSYITSEDTQAEVEQLWRDQDVEYTQIAWDDLIRYNQYSADGSAHYIVEEAVEVIARLEAEAIFSTKMSGGVELSYGARLTGESSRSFKELDDLLGAEYHLDEDLYIGDYFYEGNNMSNDLRNPNREVVEGERFGYDYTLWNYSYALIVGLDYRLRSFELSLHGELSEQFTTREGHYEKERFAGDLSYGRSSTVALGSSSVDMQMTYSPTGRHHIFLRGSYDQIPPEGDDLFLQSQSANRVIDNPCSRVLGGVNLGYRYERGNFTLDLEGYLIYSRRETEVWSYYDDMSYTYSNVVARDIGTRSVGLEVVGSYSLSRALEWDVTLSVGDYSYDTTPEVTLYDDSDMSLLSTSSASAIEGCKVGNAPQMLATSSLTHFAGRGLILSLDCSYGGGRYLSPSIVRRTDRMVLYAATTSPELAEELITQESLAGVFDASLSVTKSLWFRSDRRLSMTLRVNNLLGDRDRVEYGRESNRILTSASGSYSTARYLQSSTCRYSQPRSYYISCNYQF